MLVQLVNKQRGTELKKNSKEMNIKMKTIDIEKIRLIVADKLMIENITKLRIEVLIAANKLDSNIDMADIYLNTKEYYESSLEDGSNITILAIYDDLVIGCGSVSLFKVMPTCCNPTGKKAYIMNMYVKDEYRRNGIASMILSKLITAIKEKGDYVISLEATEMGLPLYKKFGFIRLEKEMELPYE